MNPLDIKAAIVRAGTTQRAIAEHLKVSEQSLARVINGGMRSARIEAARETATGIKMYAEPGQRGRKKSVWTGQRAAA